MELDFNMVMALAALGCTPRAINEARSARSYEQAVTQWGMLKARARQMYKAAARVHHPDMGGDPELFKLLCAAYELVQKMNILPRPQQMPSVMFVRRATWSTNSATTSNATSGFQGSGSVQW